MKYPKGNEFDFTSIRPALIRCDAMYQRNLDTKRVDKIVREFDGNVMNEPKVSFRDGVHWVFNGQHTLAAWKKMFGNDKPILCKVYKGMTWLDECEAFVKQNGSDKDPTTNDKLRALSNAKDPDVTEMVRLAELCGWIVDFNTSKAVKRIVATSALFKAYKTLDAQDYTEMLTVLQEAWGGDMDAICAQIITAMTIFYKTYSGNFKKTDLVNSLKKITPATIIRNGRTLPGRTNTYTREIVKTYNAKRRYKLDEAKL